MNEMLAFQNNQQHSYLARYNECCSQMNGLLKHLQAGFIVKRKGNEYVVSQEYGIARQKRAKRRKGGKGRQSGEKGPDEAALPESQARQWTPFGALLAASKQQYDGLQRTRSAALGRQAPATRRAPPSTTPPVGSASWMARMGL